MRAATDGRSASPRNAGTERSSHEHTCTWPARAASRRCAAWRLGSLGMARSRLHRRVRRALPVRGLLEINRDLFYGLYAIAVAGLFALWAHSTSYDLVAAVQRRWLWALGLGSAFAGVLAVMVVRTEDATARPDGLELIGAVLWRGVLYGVTDGLLLSVFPILVVFAAFAGSRPNDRFAGKIVNRCRCPDRLARDDGRLPRRLQRLSLRQGRQAADRRRRHGASRPS